MYKLIRTIPTGVATIVVVALILYCTLDSDPLNGHHINIPGFDKLVHGIMFFAMVCATSFDFAKKLYPRAVNIMLLAVLVIVASLFGGFIEWLQDAMGMGRSKDIYDFIADSAGAVVGAVAWYFAFAALTRRALDNK